MGIVECPQTEGDSAIEAAFVSFVSNRVMVTCTDIEHQSSLNRGRIVRRNCGVVIATRLAAANPSQDPGWVGSPLGSLANVQSIFRNEAATPGLAPARFTVLTTRPSKVGYFCEAGNMMASPGSDFSPVGNRRVMDIACTTAVGVAVNELNADLLANPATGTIQDREATRLEGIMNGALTNRLINRSPPDAVAVNSQVDRTNNIVATETLNWLIQIVPKAYARSVNLTLGFQL
jgi:hypothetical protein